MISSEKQSLVRFNPVDATNGRSLEKALEDVKENICINTEGLLMYFSDAEIHSFLENIKKLLDIHGGCWITADPEIMPEHIRILSAIHPGDTNHDTDSILNEKADVSVTTNSLMVRYGHEKEDVEKVKDILSEHGLKAERIRIGSHIVATKAFSLLTPEQGSAVLKAVEDIAFWKVVSAGLSENNAGADQHFTIRKEYTDGVLFLELTGRLDSLTAPQLLAKYEKQNASDVIRKVQIDCHALDYISSAGLRVLLIMQKGCKEGVSLKGMNDLVRDILDQTGFSEIIQMTV
jgi:anti-anti-sigma factor